MGCQERKITTNNLKTEKVFSLQFQWFQFTSFDSSVSGLVVRQCSGQKGMAKENFLPHVGQEAV
jgi:hypothetical protein